MYRIGMAGQVRFCQIKQFPFQVQELIGEGESKGLALNRHKMRKIWHLVAEGRFIYYYVVTAHHPVPHIQRATRGMAREGAGIHPER